MPSAHGLVYMYIMLVVVTDAGAAVPVAVAAAWWKRLADVRK